MTEEPSARPTQDFPLAESVWDHSGQLRHFTIEMHDVGLGYALDARENGVEHGYEFHAFDASSPYAALGELRRKMRRALATRHVVRPPGEGLTMLDDHVAGHIEYSAAEEDVVFVVDGVALSLEDIGRLASGREGCQFLLRFADPSDELPG